jgi:hypothetical protein
MGRLIQLVLSKVVWEESVYDKTEDCFHIIGDGVCKTMVSNFPSSF